MEYKKRSGCPISFSLSYFGDKWTLLILRDIIIHHKKYYDEFLAMAESISTNILADRLREMERQNLVTKCRDEQNRRRFIYEPTERALDLIPMLLEMAIWAAKYDAKTVIDSEQVVAMTKKRSRTIRAWRKPFEKTTRGLRSRVTA